MPDRNGKIFYTSITSLSHINKGTGVGIVIAFSRIGAAAGTFLLPILVERIGVYGTLGVCLVILLIGGVVCQLFAPETFIKEVHTAEMNENLAAN